MEKNRWLDLFVDNTEDKVYDFFYENLEFTKLGETKVSRSSAGWEEDILKKLSEEKQFVLEGTDYIIKFKEIDGDRGYAFGSVIVSNVPPQENLGYNAEYNVGVTNSNIKPPTMQENAKHIFIPVIIRDFRLSDFDIFIHNGQPHTLTEQNFFRYMYNNDIFANAANAPVGPSGSDQMADKQEPPYGNYRSGMFRDAGFTAYAAAGMKKTAASLPRGGFLEQLIPTIRPCHRARLEEFVGEENNVAQFAGTPAMQMLDDILKGAPFTGEDKAEAFGEQQPMNVVRIGRSDTDKYIVTSVSDWIYAPNTKEYDLATLMASMGTKIPDLTSILTELSVGGEISLTINHESRPLIILEDYTADPKFLIEQGAALALTEGGDIIQGNFITNVYEPNGERSAGDIFMTGDSFAYQKGVVGNPSSDDVEVKEGSISPGTWGTIMFPKDGQLAATTPFKIIAVSHKDGAVAIKVHDIYANEINYIVTPGVEKIVNLTGNKNVEVGNWINANSFAIPESYRIIHLGQRIVMQADLHEAVLTMNRKLLAIGGKATLRKEQSWATGSASPNLLVISRADTGFIFAGPAIYPIAKDDTSNYVDGAKALYYLLLLGADSATAEKILNRAKELGRITVSNCKNLTTGTTKLSSAKNMVATIEKTVGTLNRNLIKEAAMLAREDSVDTVLSLSFINPENLSIYLQNLERMEQSEDDLAQLLLLVRLGLENVNETAVENALRNLSDVNEDLRFVNKMMELKQNALSM